ncbi:MAG TPA: VWA domain-containing protein [Thermoanaerobaculia bacterium]|jgi:Ca-activated chloride channel family protein|nr:VWA domain-containing protein [Thermoanaerobaculia bacterium]
MRKRISSLLVFALLLACQKTEMPNVAPKQAGGRLAMPQPSSAVPVPVPVPVPAPPPPPANAQATFYDSVQGGVAGGVQGGVAGGVVGGVAGGVMGGVEKDAQFHTEEYGRFTENPFLRAVDNPLSTFSIDVDRASYANVRRFLNGGTAPPRDAVRIEEMINYFRYDYPDPRGGEPFSITTELAACPWNAKHQLLLVGLQGRRIKTADLPPSNLVFLIDVSGSMDEPDKLPLVKRSLQALTEQLRPDDRVAIVVYAGAAGLVLPSTPGSDKAEIARALDDLQAGGSTAGGEGIRLAYDIAKENFRKSGNNRVILATDGDFNVGVSSDGELEQLIEQKRRDGIFLTVLGFGTGNLKDSKMELLADKGNGNYAYIDSIGEARKTLVHEMGGTLLTIAKDVKIQIELNPTHVGAYRLIGYENRLLRKEDFNDDTKDAGELGAGHSVTALYEIVPPGVDVPQSSVDPLKYQKPPAVIASSSELATVKLRYKDPDGEESRLLTEVVADAPAASMSDNLRMAAAVAELGMLLRNSEHKGEASYDEALQLARSVRGEDAEGYRADFMALVAKARSIGG